VNDAQDESGTCADGDIDPVGEMKGKYKNKSAHVVIVLLYDLLSCVYDKDIGRALKDESAKVEDIKWLDVEALLPLREIFRLMGVHNGRPARRRRQDTEAVQERG
jgi:hypothetical protein